MDIKVNDISQIGQVPEAAKTVETVQYTIQITNYQEIFLNFVIQLSFLAQLICFFVNIFQIQSCRPGDLPSQDRKKGVQHKLYSFWKSSVERSKITQQSW